MRDFCHFSVHVAYVRGSVLLRQGDEIPRERDRFGVSAALTMHFNVFAANNVMQQQKTIPSLPGVMGVH